MSDQNSPQNLVTDSAGPETATSSFGFRDVDAREKAGLVHEVFARVASKYDLMNDVMSMGVHHLWKDAACARLNPQPGEVIIDCAGGTGDIARRLMTLARAAKARNQKNGRGKTQDVDIRVIDYNQAMIEAGIARGVKAGKPEPEISWAVGDAMNLPLPDQSANAYIISFGLRNVTDVAQALHEARRVLKPGGRFFCLEFSHPTTGVVGEIYDAYSFKLIPLFGQIIANDRESYQYLVESIRRFPDQERLKAMMEAAGFKRPSYTNYSGGVCALHQGWA